MAATTFTNVLNFEMLSGLIKEVIDGVPGDLLPSSFMTSNESFEGKVGTYDRIATTRQAARIVNAGSPSVNTKLQGISKQPITLIHSFEHQNHPAEQLISLRNEGGDGKQTKGEQTIAGQVREFGRGFSNLRQGAVYSLLAKGAIFVGADGSLLASGSGAAYTIDFDVPAGNKDQLNVLGDGDILDTDWTAAGTDINAQIEALKSAARKLTGYPIKHAFYGTNVAGYLWANTQIKAAITGSSRTSELMTAGELPDGLLGLNWHPVNQAFFELVNGTVTDWFGANDVIFTPDPSPDWYDMIEGSHFVPTDLTVGADASAMLANIAEVTGGFSYAELATDPLSVKHMAGDTFSPVLKVPKALFIGEVPTA